MAAKTKMKSQVWLDFLLVSAVPAHGLCRVGLGLFPRDSPGTRRGGRRGWSVRRGPSVSVDELGSGCSRGTPSPIGAAPNCASHARRRREIGFGTAPSFSSFSHLASFTLVPSSSFCFRSLLATGFLLLFVYRFLSYSECLSVTRSRRKLPADDCL